MRNFIADDVLEFASEFCFDKHIARIEKPCCTDTLSVPDSVNFFCRNKDLCNEILKTASLNFLFELLLGFLLFSACCPQYMPFFTGLAHKQGNFTGCE